MKQFPKLNQALDDELIFIIHFQSGDYQADAILYAKKLLQKRGLSETDCKKRSEELGREFEIEEKNEIARRKEESYSVLELIVIALFWYHAVFSNWNLNNDGYPKKRKQRLIAILSGILLYVGMILIDIPYMKKQQKKNLNEITQIGINDSISLAQINWSGVYTFSNSSNTTKNSEDWKLLITKLKHRHTGTLIINNDSSKLSVDIKKGGATFYTQIEYAIINEVEFTSNEALFTLTHQQNSIFTQWENIRPHSLINSNGFGVYFLKEREATTTNK